VAAAAVAVSAGAACSRYGNMVVRAETGTGTGEHDAMGGCGSSGGRDDTVGDGGSVSDESSTPMS
jgi:hypothetical protein